MARKQRIDVMLSSTFRELVEHRDAVLEAMVGLDLNPVAQEYDGALDADLIKASLEKVDRSDAYVGVIGLRYGQCPICDDRNPDRLSLAELEYRRAVELGLPRYFFISRDEHKWDQRDIELRDREGGDGREKRQAFIELVRRDRVSGDFASPQNLQVLATKTFVTLKQEVEQPGDERLSGDIADIKSMLLSLTHGNVAQAEVLQRQVDELRSQSDIKDRAIAEFLSVFGESPLGANELAQQLHDFAGRYRQLLDSVSRSTNMPAALEGLRRRAQEAIEAGDLDCADRIFADIDVKHELSIREQQEALDQTSFERGEIQVRRAQIALTRLDYKTAAHHFGEAAASFPESVIEKQRLARLSQADALSKYGEIFLDPASLRRSLAIYTGYAPLIDREKEVEEWARIQNNLGAALAILGDRGDRAAQRDAINAFEALADVHLSAGNRVEWADARNNVASVLLSVAKRGDADAARASVDVCRAALEFATREVAPDTWARLQGNLGNALSILGELNNDGALLEEAHQAQKAFLEVWTKEDAPRGWATMQMNMGSTLRQIAERGEKAAFHQAIDACQSACEVFTKEADPEGWGYAQYHLGCCALRLGELGDVSEIHRAIEAFNNSLEVRLRHATVADWAETQFCLGRALMALAMASNSRDFGQAKMAAEAALEGFTEVGSDFWVAQTKLMLAQIEELSA